jgi:uncharacterized protein YifN (PemK superfamily)
LDIPPCISTCVSLNISAHAYFTTATHHKSLKIEEHFIMAKTKIEKIAGIDEQIAQLENQRKWLVQEQKAQEGKDRTRAFASGRGYLKACCPKPSHSRMSNSKLFSKKPLPTVTGEICVPES